jgi:hypothetical protein
MWQPFLESAGAYVRLPARVDVLRGVLIHITAADDMARARCGCTYQVQLIVSAYSLLLSLPAVVSVVLRSCMNGDAPLLPGAFFFSIFLANTPVLLCESARQCQKQHKIHLISLLSACKLKQSSSAWFPHSF